MRAYRFHPTKKAMNVPAPRASGYFRVYAPSRMRVRVVLAVICFAVGVVWFGQGIGLIGGSFMTGEAVWAVIGAIMILFGLALVSGVRRDRLRSKD